MDYMLPEGDWLGTFADGDRLAECGIPAPPGGKAGQRWDGSAWADTPDAEVRAAHRLEIMAEMITSQRETLSCQRWQMLLVLGEARWAKIEAFRDSPMCNWPMRQVIDNAEYLPRVSQFVDMLAYILGLTEAETDAMFALAMAERV